ncbi:MAG: UDP-N-acetylglucosamine 2-epimerase (non-hydrolyzing) [Pirellulales bacterium]
MPSLRAFLTFGTRPEAIKMAPIIDECRRRSDEIETVVCLTGQHRELLAQVTDYFDIRADVDLAVMRPDQSPAEVTARCLAELDGQLARIRPHCVVAQGDTSTVMAAALAAFLRRIPLVHVEAGLRTGNLLSPWPEEMNRRVASLAATLHCAPTMRAAANLEAEGVLPSNIHVTGNTVIDALLSTRQRERANAAHWQRQFAMLGDRRLVLVTGHRRENLGAGLERVCQAIATLATRFPDVVFLYPVHLNPRVQSAVRPLLAGLANVQLVEPVGYPAFVWLMDRSHLILTDSGGIQEEAPSLGKPVLVTRDTTERPEAVEAGAVELVGTDVERIVSRTTLLLTDREAYAQRRIDVNPYGDGQAARRIVELMLGQGWGDTR